MEYFKQTAIRLINVNFVQAYTPTADSCEEAIQTFYNDSKQAVSYTKSHEVDIIRK